jgi:DNA-binding NtrC family response regulator
MTEKHERRILVVDDDRDMCESLADVITLDRSYKAIYTTSPKKAVQIAEKGDVSLVILDYKMAEMDGLDTLRAIKSVSPFLPVLMLTAFISNDLIEEARREGAFMVLSKYIWPDELLKHIEKALEAESRYPPEAS